MIKKINYNKIIKLIQEMSITDHINIILLNKNKKYNTFHNNILFHLAEITKTKINNIEKIHPYDNLFFGRYTEALEFLQYGIIDRFNYHFKRLNLKEIKLNNSKILKNKYFKGWGLERTIGYLNLRTKNKFHKCLI